MRATFGPFETVFPPGNLRHHFAGQEDARGVYAKELHIPKGFRLVSHAHRYDHISILACGEVMLTIGTFTKWVKGPCAVMIEKGANHELQALTDAVWFCVHPTDKIDTAEIDETLIVREAV